MNDCLKQTTQSEQSRKNIHSILIANFKRAQESARVLEEITKLNELKQHDHFKEIRYSLYDLERKLLNLQP